MDIKINFTENKSYIKNLAFIRALLIKISIEQLEIEYDEKLKLYEDILEYLKNN
jgi:hypothetical protein